MVDEVVEQVEQEKKSTSRVEVVPIVLEKHPYADALSIVNVFGGYTCCVNTEQWKGVKYGAYIPPDSTVDITLPEFTFLSDKAKNGRARIRAVKLRKIVSYGLLVPAPPGSKEGDDVAEALKVEHYEPPIAGEGSPNGVRLYMGGEVATGPNVYTVKYDVDALKRYHALFVPDEPVLVTEKLDGSNARYVFHDGQMYCGSRTEWKKEYPDYSHVKVENLIKQGVPEDRANEIIANLLTRPKRRNMWWEILSRTPALEEFCKKHPGMVVYGEAFGNIGRIKYGVPDQFAAFDIMHEGKWLDGPVARALLIDHDVPVVPLVAAMLYDFATVTALAEGDTLIPGATKGTIREGVVIKPLIERRNKHIGRVQLKCVAAEYLLRY